MVKYQVEYPVKSSIKVLYNCLSTPSGLSEWFCDDVNLEKNGAVYNFMWDGVEQKAELLTSKENSHIKFRWIDEDEETYFEFRIQIDGITGDVALVITDFAEEDEKEESILLWDSQVKDLMQAIGV